MTFVYADDSRNLLHLILVGKLDEAAAQECLCAVERSLVTLRDGFQILTDLRDLKEVDSDAVPVIDALMTLCNNRGVRKVVRVVREATGNHGFMIMSAFHYNHDVRFVTCDSLENARRLSGSTGGSNKALDGIGE